MIVKLLRELYNTYDDHLIQYMGDDLIQVKACKYKYWYSVLITVDFLNDAENAIDHIIGIMKHEMNKVEK